MGWENSETKPPKKPGIYYVAARNETSRDNKTCGHLYSYWNGERWGYRTISKESALKNADKDSPQGLWPWYWEEGVDQPYMKKNAENDLPARNGAAWTIEEEQQLLKEYTKRIPIEDIAEIHKRVPRAIEIQLDRIAPQWGEELLQTMTCLTPIQSRWNPEFLKQKIPGISSPRNKLLLLL